MYRINNLLRGVLITTDEVVFHAPTKQTLDPRTIQNSIIIAEERFIIPALGYSLYYDLVNSKNVVVSDANKATLQAKFTNIALQNGMLINAYEQMSADYQTLWLQQLWKLVAECVMVIAMPEAFVQFGSEGVMHNMPVSSPLHTQGQVTPDLKSVKWVMDKKIMDRIEPLLNALTNWICWKRTVTPAIYPLYTIECPCDKDSTKQGSTIDIALGLYDDEPDCGCSNSSTPTPPWYD